MSKAGKYSRNIGMTSDEWIKNQKEKLQKAHEKAFKIAVFDSHRLMGNRIFVNGDDSNDQKIGSYNSTDPIYVNPKNSPRKFATGKFKNGQPRKTKKFQSYKSFRQAVGRKTNVVNLNLFGILQNDFITGLRKVDKNTYESVLKQAINVKKVNGQEKHWGKDIFSLSKHEREQFFETIRRETLLILR